MGPSIVNVFLSITNMMQRYMILFITVNALSYMFQAVSPPIIRSSKLYTQHRVFVRLVCCYRIRKLELKFQLTHASGFSAWAEKRLKNVRN
jgi:hypothetical protein